VSQSTRHDEIGGFRHLTRRFAGSLWPGGPGVAEEAWARRWLRPAEVEIWKAMTGPDRRHGVAVARRVAVVLGNADGAGIPTNALAAALLHDAGKSRSRLGVLGRSAATLAAAGAGRRRVATWRDAGGWRAEAGRYAAHDEIGGEMLAAAGSDPVVVAWAREHHRPPADWSLDPGLAGVLKAADDD
jgi:hypothetical protein